MKQPRHQDLTRTVDDINSCKSSIIVEKSYEVSVEHSTDQSIELPNQAELSQSRSRSQQDLTPSTTHDTEAPVVRPSTARPKSNPYVPIGRDPSVRASQVTMDLHEALRSQNPAFRQSKRWAKTYMNEKSGIEPVSSGADSHTREENALNGDVSRQTYFSPALDTKEFSDTEVEHYGFCQPAHLPGWQAWKQRRLLKCSSVPADISKIAVPRTIGPKKSTKSLKARAQAIQRRVTIPKAVSSGSETLEEQHGIVLMRPIPRKKSRRTHKSPYSLFANQNGGHNRRSNVSLSSLHDYEKVKRFSQECMNMLSGLDFGEEWRLSVIAPGLNLPWKQSLEGPRQIGQSYQIPRTPDADSRAAAQNQDKSFQVLGLSVNQQPSMDGTGNQASPIGNLHEPVCLSQKTPTSTISSEFRSYGEASTTSSFRGVGGTRSTSSSHRFAAREYSRGMKNTRSVDTLTQIEAQVDAQHTARHHLEKKESTFTLSSSPHRQRPSGDPPGRPLPSIPRDDTVANRVAPHECSILTKCHDDKAILDTLEVVNPVNFNLTQSMVAMPIGGKVIGMNSHNASSTSDIFNTTKYRIGASGSSMISSQGSMHKSDEDMPPTLLKSKEVMNRRSSKIQEMKKRDLAMWNTSQETVNTFSWEASTGQSTTSVETQPNCTAQKPIPAQNPADKSSIESLNNLKLLTQKVYRETHLSQRTDPIHQVPSVNRLLTMTGERTSSENGQSAIRADSSHYVQARSDAKLQMAAPLPRSRQNYDQPERPKQLLSHSQIMVVVDTNPHTSGFRAGAMSPARSMVAAEHRPTTPLRVATGRQVTKSLLSGPVKQERTTPSESSIPTDLIDIVKPPASLHKKRSARGLRTQVAPARNAASDAVKQVPEYASSVKIGSRGRSRPSRNIILDSSDSDLAQSSPLKEINNSLSSRSRNKSRSSQPKSHMRKDTPLTLMLKDEVRKTDQQLEDLKKYEKRIEDLQLHLEQTMKVWGRMSQNGKRQYLHSTFGTADAKCNTRSKGQAQVKDIDVASGVTSSVHNRGSNVQRLDDPITRSYNDAREFSQRALDENHCISSISTAVISCPSTDTDTDGSTRSDDSSVAKRISGGSLTDPHDYDLPPSPLSDHSLGSINFNDKQTPRKKNGEKLCANLDELRNRLYASRPLGIPARRYKLSSSPRSATSKESTTRPGTGIASVTTPRSERLAIAPWEELEQYPRHSLDSGTGENATYGTHEGERNELLEFNGETLGTDQMDAMLAL